METENPNNPFSLDRLYEDFNDQLWRIVCRYIKDKYDREDAMQEIFTSVVKKKPELPTQLDASKYLCTAATNKVNDYIDKLKTYEKHIKIILDDEDTSEVILISEEDDPAEQLIKKEMATVLRKFIDELKPIHAEVIRLKFLKNKTPDEIAQELGVSVNTIYSRLTRAKEILKEKLENFYYEGGLQNA